MELPFIDNHFDRVFHINSLYYWPCLDQSISELLRVMKPEGLMLTTFVLDRKDTFVNAGLLRYATHCCPDTYMEKLTQTGFSDVSMKSLKTKSGFKFELIHATA